MYANLFTTYRDEKQKFAEFKCAVYLEGMQIGVGGWTEPGFLSDHTCTSCEMPMVYYWFAEAICLKIRYV